MDVRTMALLTGVKAESVVEHKQLNGAYMLRVALKNEPELRRAFEQRPIAQAPLQDGDIFNMEFIRDGAPGHYVPDHIEKYRSMEWGEIPIPAWRLRAEVSPPNSSYGAVLERFVFWFFDRHDGSYDLSTPNDQLQRPWQGYSLGYQSEAGYVSFIGSNPVSGFIEVSNKAGTDNTMRLSAAWSSVVINMPNCHEFIEQAPDREFVVQSPIGFYELTGQL